MSYSKFSSQGKTFLRVLDPEILMFCELCIHTVSIPSIAKHTKKTSLYRIEIKEKLFSAKGDLKVKCTATIDSIYWKSNEVSIQGNFKRNFPLDIHSGFWNSGFSIEL